MRFECGHAFPTPEALLADHAALIERLNANPLPDPFGPDHAAPLAPKTDPEAITACPHCSHDL
ncbi:hypothetical protein EDD27_3607 [Nonomuraea polychroma]|uniref:Uncharacterized protein n=1 Tax=Nonomuraea polychroma TaxID=46176 RepID=A0A438M698_9ACTN|nr:hypothetical protein [Nonomuraea polychroma]RVX41138.1 hypothetical protein EDD27_3607 [Nonomuraea polychroma]